MELETQGTIRRMMKQAKVQIDGLASSPSNLQHLRNFVAIEHDILDAIMASLVTEPCPNIFHDEQTQDNSGKMCPLCGSVVVMRRVFN